MKLAGIGTLSRKRMGQVLQSCSGVITAASVMEALNVDAKEANSLLARWCQNGWLQRVKRGAYVAIPVDANDVRMSSTDPFVIITSLYEGYIGGFSAVKHWDLSEQIIETTYYFTDEKVKEREPVYGNFKFKIKTVKSEKIFGLKSIWYGSQKIRVSDPHKTIVDILDDPKVVGGMTVVYDIYRAYADSEYVNFETLLAYANKMNNKTIFKRLGFMLLAKEGRLPNELEGIHQDISNGYSNFDPLLDCDLTNDDWKLKIPASWKDAYDRKK